MARFDVHGLRDGAGYVLDCQADLLSHYQTRFVVPLMQPDQGPAIAERLNPVFIVEERELVMYTQYAGSIPKADMGPVVMSLSEHDAEIMRAIDWLLSGY